MIRDGDELSGDKKGLGIFLIAVPYAFGSLCLRHLLCYSGLLPVDVDGFLLRVVPCGCRWLLQ